MATTNGTLTPPSLPPAPTSPSLAKRKRSETDALVSNGASASTPEKLAHGAGYSLQTVLEDILSILKSYDTQPSLLTHPITTSLTRASSGEADSKRAKLTPPAGPTTITNLIQEGSYESLHALEKDVDNAVEEILASIGTSELTKVPMSLEDTRLQTKVLAFQKMLKTLVNREEARRAHIQAKQSSNTTEKDTPGDEDEAVPIKEEAKEDAPESRTVLTLFGSAQGPKQLFSSLQQPQSVPSDRATSELDTSIKVTLPLRESTLPNIISTTDVFPLPAGVEEKKKKSATIGEVFRAPAHLPQIAPPKLAKPLTTKGSTVTFAPPETPKPGRKNSQSYASQNLSTGIWLGYGGVGMPKDPTSPTAKQKSRQRALSTGEAQQPPSEATLAAVQQAREDALFRSAYSSFAPSRDDSTAIIPEETKNKVWWQKIGEKRFNDIFPIDPALLGTEEYPKGEANGSTEEDDFEDVVKNFEPVDGGAFPEAKTSLENNTDEVEDVLKEISELLETLASHQRIRNSSMTTNPRTPVIQNSSLASLAGSPSTPSSEEVDVYQLLKSQLSLMISQLPPYAVAKLNGDQLEELNISRTILIETRDYNGVLEEDQFSRKALSMPAATAPPNLTRMTSSGSGSHSHYPPNTQYGRPSTSVHSSSARPVQPTQSYYPQQQSIHRSPSVHYQRSSSGATQGYQAPTPSFGSTPRQSFSATQGYGQQTPRPSYGQSASGQYYQQRPAQPSNYSGTASSQYFGSTPQNQAQNRYAQQQTQNGYYQRPQNVATMYSTAQTPHARTGSPLKANPQASQPNYASRPSSYMTPASNGQSRSTIYGASQYSTPQPPTPSTTAPSGYGSISSNPQMMLERQQQAQAAAQSQARLAAQNSFNNRQGSGTPQPAPNGQYGGQQQVNGGTVVS